MSRHFLPIGITLLAAAIIFAMCANRPARGVEIPSFQRIYADAPISVVVVRASVDASGQVNPRKEAVGNITKDQNDRVLDYLSEPGYSYVTACQFTQRDPITYWWTGYLPITVRPRVRQ